MSVGDQSKYCVKQLQGHAGFVEPELFPYGDCASIGDYKLGIRVRYYYSLRIQPVGHNLVLGPQCFSSWDPRCLLNDPCAIQADGFHGGFSPQWRSEASGKEIRIRVEQTYKNQ